jgi:hypothetical protein
MTPANQIASQLPNLDAASPNSGDPFASCACEPARWLLHASVFKKTASSLFIGSKYYKKHTILLILRLQFG